MDYDLLGRVTENCSDRPTWRAIDVETRSPQARVHRDLDGQQFDARLVGGRPERLVVVEMQQLAGVEPVVGDDGETEQSAGAEPDGEGGRAERVVTRRHRVADWRRGAVRRGRGRGRRASGRGGGAGGGAGDGGPVGEGAGQGAGQGADGRRARGRGRGQGRGRGRGRGRGA